MKIEKRVRYEWEDATIQSCSNELMIFRHTNDYYSRQQSECDPLTPTMKSNSNKKLKVFVFI